MRGKLNDQESLFVVIRLEEIVPKNHLLRRIKEAIDFSFIDEHTEGLYSDKGRPSIDPQVLIRMMLIGYLFGITSERRLCEEVHLNMAYRWFCGLGLEQKVPNHSTFTKNRNGRFSQTDLFRKLFYEVVKQAQEKGLIKGQYWSIDATLVRADAAMNSLEPIEVSFTQDEYLEALDRSHSQTLDTANDEKKDKKASSKSKLSMNDTHRSRTDPQSRIATRWGSKKQLCYCDNILVDSAENIILDVEVTQPTLKEEGLASIEMTKRCKFKLGIIPKGVAGDSAYGTGAMVAGFKEADVDIYTPRPRPTPRPKKKIFTRERFTHNVEKDCLICPNAKELKHVEDKSKPNLKKYVSTKKQCANCPLKNQCTGGQLRVVQLNRHQKEADWAESLRGTSAYKKAQYKRKQMERLFGEAKEQMGLRRAKMRGKENITEQCLMTAMAQNIKRIINSTKLPARGLQACAKQLSSSYLSLRGAYINQFKEMVAKIIALTRIIPYQVHFS